MALIDCPECRHKVSDQADACPSCGRRLTEQVSALEAELARIDMERRRVLKTLMLRSGWGWERVPTKAFALVNGALLLVPGLLIVVLFGAALAGEPGFALEDGLGGLCFGVILVLAGLGLGGYLHRRASAYQKAKAAYWHALDAARKRHGD